MKHPIKLKYIFIIILLITVPITSFIIINNSKISKEHGQIIVINNFYSPQLDKNKTIRIYLPADYSEHNNKYPVMYMQDGQNLFDEKTASYNKEWNIDETLNKLSKYDDFKGLIIVGIDSDRTSDFF